MEASDPGSLAAGKDGELIDAAADRDGDRGCA